jgi:hypothetical protein
MISSFSSIFIVFGFFNHPKGEYNQKCPKEKYHKKQYRYTQNLSLHIVYGKDRVIEQHQSEKGKGDEILAFHGKISADLLQITSFVYFLKGNFDNLLVEVPL